MDERIKEAFQDPVKFCRVIVGFEPTEYQLDLIDKFKNEQFVAARWCRQSGKSHIIAAMLLWYALTHPTSHIAIVGPSWRQTKIIIRRINTFLRRLPKQFYDRVLRTMVRLNNGSLIEAFPNNPETIRGPTLHVVYCDEMNFIANDEELYDAILFTLGTTNGKFVCTSTPWSTDSIFYRIWHDKAFRDFATSHITYKQALEEKGGPLKKQIVDKIRKQFEGDPWRWQREMMAEWAEDESVWLPQALISSCIDHQLELYEFDDLAKGEFYAGLDLGKYQDYSVLEVVQLKDEIVSLVHEHRFPLKTPYASVIGYVKTLSDRWGFRKVLVDMSGVGDYIVEDMVNAGIRETDGVKFTQPAKEELATYMKQLMVQGKFKLSYNSDLIAELNVERFELAKTGAIKFSHPEGTHDDRFWALALAVMATRKGESPSRLVRAY